MYVSRWFFVFDSVVVLVRVCGGSLFFRKSLFLLFVGFLFIRVPYVYGLVGFGCFVGAVIFPLFLVLVFRRLREGVGDVVASFIPEGSPLVIAPLVCVIEVVSYFIRPVVLMFRPFFNLTAGAIFGHLLSGWCIESWYLVLFWAFLFFYEVFVALIHWFIVSDILAFSEHH